MKLDPFNEEDMIEITEEEFNEILTNNLSKPNPDSLEAITNMALEIENIVRAPLKPVNNMDLTNQIIVLIKEFDEIFHEDEPYLEEDGWVIDFKIKDYRVQFIYFYNGIPKDRTQPISTILTTTIQITENHYDSELINIVLDPNDNLNIDIDIGYEFNTDHDKHLPFVIRILNQVAEYSVKHKLEAH